MSIEERLDIAQEEVEAEEVGQGGRDRRKKNLSSLDILQQYSEALLADPLVKPKKSLDWEQGAESPFRREYSLNLKELEERELRREKERENRVLDT